MKTNRPGMLLALLVLLQCGCFSEGGPDVAGECGPQDLTPTCCLKENPGQWERCTGVSEMEARSLSLGVKVVAGTTGVAMAASGVTIPAEQRSIELAVDLRRKIEPALERCTREADKQVNGFHLNGESPSQALCAQLKIGEQTWAAYLGLLKHEEAWPCLRKALDELVGGRYLLHPRFQYNLMTGKWEYMKPEYVSQIVYREGWKGLKGTIEPDIVILDAHGVIVLVYDLKFPCPESNAATWTRYTEGPWQDMYQGDLYLKALKSRPFLVSPRKGTESY